MNAVFQFFSNTFKDSWSVTRALFKVMIPTIIVVKIFEELGGVTWFSDIIAPVMTQMGLPAETGLVWATIMFVNIYAGIVVLINLDISMTVAQASILGTMALLAHSMPIEVGLAKKSGVSVWWTLLLRVGGAMILAVLLNYFYQLTGWHQDIAQIVWQPTLTSDPNLLDWLLGQAQNLLLIAVLIFVLILVLNVLKILGIEALIAKLLRPFLRLLGINPKATNLTLIGITLGLSYGGGLLINEAKQGHIPPKDIFTAMSLLGLLHSLIEDTLLMLVIGANFHVIFWSRLVFALLVIAVISRLINKLSGSTYSRWFYRSVV